MTQLVEKPVSDNQAENDASYQPVSHEARVLTALIGCMMVADDVFPDAAPGRLPKGQPEFRQRVAY